MQTKLIIRSVLIFLITTCVALALQSETEANKVQNHEINRDKRLIFFKKHNSKPGFFRTLFSVIYEQWSDTKNTVNKVNRMVNENFAPENAPVTIATTPASTDPNATTTKAPFKIKRSEFNKIINRNLRGLVRLFNIELQDALKISVKNDAVYRKNASLEVSKFL